MGFRHLNMNRSYEPERKLVDTTVAAYRKWRDECGAVRHAHLRWAQCERGGEAPCIRRI